MERKELIQEILKLNRTDRIEFALEVWELLAVRPEDLPMNPGHLRECHRRLEYLQKYPESAIDLRDAVEQLSVYNGIQECD